MAQREVYPMSKFTIGFVAGLVLAMAGVGLVLRSIPTYVESDGQGIQVQVGGYVFQDVGHNG